MKRETDKWNRTEIPELAPNIYGNLAYDKGSISNHCGKDRYLINCAGTTV